MAIEPVDNVFETADKATDFTFNDDVANVFDDMVQRSVPYYAEVQRMVTELAGRLAAKGSTIYDLGCSTATTLCALAQTTSDPSVKLIGVDNSLPMLIKAREKLDAKGLNGRIELLEADLCDEIDLTGASVVMMNWTLQFIRPINRDAVIRRVAESLNEGGCLILVEKVLANDPALNRLYIDLYYEYKARQGYSEMAISKKREALENVLVPYLPEENLLLLQRNHFRAVDVFFKWYNFAGFVALK